MAQDPDDRPLDEELDRRLPESLSAANGERHKAVKVLLGIGGVVMIFFGIAGLVLPLAPGLVPLFIGLFLLGLVSVTVRQWLNWLDRQLPERQRRILRSKLRK